MTRTLWIETRRSPLAWWLPALVVVDLALLFTQDRTWVGVWPQASAQAQLAALVLGPLVAAGAAWAASRAGLSGARPRLAAASRPRWLVELVLLTSTCLVGMAAYLVGVFVAGAVSVHLGIALVSGRVLGWHLAWVMPLGLFLPVAYVGVDAAGVPRWWFWMDRGPADVPCWLVAAGLLLAGAAAYSLSPWRVYWLRRRADR